MLSGSVDSLKSLKEGLGLGNDSIMMHPSLAQTTNHHKMSLAQYLEEHKLPSVAETTNSAKKDAIAKRERNRGGS